MDYKIEAIDVLLCEDCILPRYVPLIPHKKTLLDNLIRNHRLSKSDCMTLSDDDLIEMGLPDEELAKLFRSFLVMYDVKPGKFKEIAAVAANEDEKKSFYQLYQLPGVKAVRARLYYDAGYKNLQKIAAASPEQIIRDTAELILQRALTIKPPLPKEVRTHIAVAKMLTLYAL